MDPQPFAGQRIVALSQLSHAAQAACRSEDAATPSEQANDESTMRFHPYTTDAHAERRAAKLRRPKRLRRIRVRRRARRDWFLKHEVNHAD